MGIIKEGELVPSYSIEIDDTDFSVVAISDAHVGDEGFNEELFQAYMKFIREDKNRYGVCLGDLYNLYTHFFVPAGMWVQTLTPQQQNQYLKRVMRQMKDKILAMCIGNHEYKGMLAPTSGDYTEDLCGINNALYLGSGGYFILDVTHPEGRTDFVFMMSHTLGGSRRKAYKLIQIVEQMGFDDADIVLGGHQHTMIHLPFTRVRIVDKRYKFKRIDAVRCGSSLNYPDYAVYKGLPPAQLGFPILDISVKPRGVRVDIAKDNLAYR
jgi:hypothetical protein